MGKNYTTRYCFASENGDELEVEYSGEESEAIVAVTNTEGTCAVICLTKEVMLALAGVITGGLLAKEAPIEA